jgi:hypothetical protein
MRRAFGEEGLDYKIFHSAAEDCYFLKTQKGSYVLPAFELARADDPADWVRLFKKNPINDRLTGTPLDNWRLEAPAPKAPEPASGPRVRALDLDEAADVATPKSTGRQLDFE